MDCKATKGAWHFTVPSSLAELLGSTFTNGWWLIHVDQPHGLCKLTGDYSPPWSGIRTRQAVWKAVAAFERWSNDRGWKTWLNLRRCHGLLPTWWLFHFESIVRTKWGKKWKKPNWQRYSSERKMYLVAWSGNIVALHYSSIKRLMRH